MKFKVDKDNLLTAINRISPIVRSNPKSLEALQNVAVYSYSSNVYIEASSARSSARVAVRDAQLIESGRFIINHDKLRDRVSKTSGVIAVVEEESKPNVAIVAGDDQLLTIVKSDIREFPTITWEYPDESYSVKVPQFIDLLSRSTTVLKDASSLTPAFLQAKVEDNNWKVSTGLSHYVYPVECNSSLSVSIPQDSLKSIGSFIKDSRGSSVWVSQLGDTVVVTVDDDQLQASSLSIDFPDTRDMMSSVKVSSQHELEFDRQRLVRELRNAASSTDSSGKITLSVEGTVCASMKILAVSDVGDTYSSIIPCMWSGGSGRSMEFTQHSLLTFLQQFECDTLIVNVGDSIRGSHPPLYCEEGGTVAVLNQYR